MALQYMTNEQKGYYIFGAHSRAQTLAEYMRVLKPEYVLSAYLVDNDEDNPTQIGDVPVRHLGKESDGLDVGAEVWLGIRGIFHEQVSSRLKEIGFSDIIPVTPALDSELRNEYMKKTFCAAGRSFIKLDDYDAKCSGEQNDIKSVIYVAKSDVDRPLQKVTPLKEYERIIQVGRALTGADIPGADELDDSGENISERNRQFSELTGLYWIWKHSAADVIGLEHYRRRFILSEGWEKVFSKDKIDVILPTPLYVSPDLQGNYLFRHDRRPWDAMMKQLKDKPEMYDSAAAFFANTGCYSPCNMLIARREVLDELCSWLFPILLDVADEIGQLSDTYQNRYAGFLSERMITFFFYHYADKYRVLYADKTFLG